MRKNLYALAIAGILAVSTMAPTMVSAATTPQTHETPVSYKYKDPSLTFDGFTVTVPAALDMTSDNASVIDKVTVTMEANRTLPTGKSIFVSVNSANAYKLKVEGQSAATATDPTYELKALKQDGQPANDTAFTGAVLANTSNEGVAEFPDTDFDGGATEVVKNAWLNAKIKTKPQVGLDNQKFVDTLTFTVSVKNSSVGG